MALTKNELSKALINTLKIDANAFNYEAINEAIDLVPVERYMEFYKEVIGSNYFGNGIKAVLEISEKYKSEKIENLFSDTREQAKAMYDKFYFECCAMLDFCSENRNKYPNDREFFESIDYSKLKKKDGSNAYTKQELYVLNALGGGGWLIDIRYHANAKVVIDMIEKIIKDAISIKYIEDKKTKIAIIGVA